MAGVVPQPIFSVSIGGKNVTTVLTPYLLEVGYVDHEEGEADSIDIRLDNADGRFWGAWAFRKGQTVALQYGYVGGVVRDTGLFELDEVEFEGPGDVVVIKALGTGVSHAYRTHKAKAYESTTLAALAQQIAKRLHLQLVGTIEPIAIRRVTQVYESDVAFLHRVASDYGYAFSIRGPKLVFVRRAQLRSSGSVITIDRTDVTSYRIKDKLKDVPKSTSVKYHDPKSGRVRHYNVTDTGSTGTSADSMRLNIRAESDAQAKAKATAAMAKAAEDAVEVELTLFGAPEIVAGTNFGLSSFGRYSGQYHALRTRHRYQRGDGYKTIVEARRVVPHGT